MASDALLLLISRDIVISVITGSYNDVSQGIVKMLCVDFCLLSDQRV